MADPLMSFNFALIDIPVQALFPLAFPIKLLQSALTSGTFIGFQSISLPEMTISTQQIVEGNWPLVHTVLKGHTTSGTATLTQAVISINADMYFWFQQAMWGRIAPRRDFLVIYTRADKRIPQRILQLEGCIPVSWRPSSDLSAESSSVVVESLTMSVYRITPIPLPIPTVKKPNQPAFPSF